MSNKGIVRREGDITARAKAYKSLARVGSLKAEYNITTTEVTRLENILEQEKMKLKSIQDGLARTLEELSLVVEEIDSDKLPEGAQPVKRIQRRDKLSMQAQQLDVAVKVQGKVVADAIKAIAAAERKRFEADKNLSMFVDQIEEAEAAIEVQAALDKDRAEKLAELEIKRAKRWENEQKIAMETRSQQMHELSELATKQVEAAKIYNKQAVQISQNAFENTKSVINKIAKYKEQVHNERTEAILELKANTNAVFDELKQSADKYRAKIKQNKDELESEKDNMINKGLNPYVEFRKREFAIEGKHREQRMKNAVEENKSKLSETLLTEEDIARKEEIKERKERLYEKKYRDELGRHVVEERTRSYINTITAAHVDILDPTGRASRVDPSKITDVPDFSFGLGKSARIPVENMQRITDNIRRKLKVSEDEVGEYDRLLSKYKDIRETKSADNNTKLLKNKNVNFHLNDDDDDEHNNNNNNNESNSTTNIKENVLSDKMLETKRNELLVLANETGTMPGTDHATAIINLKEGDNDMEKLLRIAAEETGDNIRNQSNQYDVEISKYKTVTLTKFEKDCFENAKTQQNNRLKLGTEQIAGGRLFQGDGFVSKPSILEFKDFEVGVIYKKRFILTNASYTFNSFKLLNLTDDVIDFFEIVFEKPGRVSAGVSCPLDITFVPKTNKDIFTQLKFLTETGPIEIPVRCLIKRCAPIIVSPSIDFNTVIIGQVVKIPLVIKNTEALSSTFTISRKDIPGKPLMKAKSGRIMTLKDLPLEEMLATTTNNNLNNNNNNEHDLISNDTVIDILESIIHSDPATSETELWSRVKRIMTAVLQQKKVLNPYPLDIETISGTVLGYSETIVNVVSAPLIVGTAQQDFIINFHNVDESMMTVDANKQLIKKKVDILTQVISDDVPIYVAEEVLDMKCCMYDRIYRTRVELKSRAKAAYRIDLKISAPLNQYIEVNPSMLFVQAGGSQIINIKFAPTLKMLTDIKHLTMLHDQYINAVKFAIPIEIKVVTQDLPLYFVLTGDVCQSTIELSTNTLDYDKAYISQCSTLPLTVTNTSMLAQKIGFVKVSKELSIEPNDGFCCLLPKESFTFNISFSPKSVIDYDFDLNLVTSSNDTYLIHIKGKGIELPLNFTVPVIKMRTTCPGERVLESCIVENKSTTQQCCEIIVPDIKYTWLRISPAVIDLAPGNSCRIDIEYIPPNNLITLNPQKWLEDLNKSNQNQNQNVNLNENENNSPFNNIMNDSGWTFFDSMYGTLQWSIPPPIFTRQSSLESVVSNEQIENNVDNNNVDNNNNNNNDLVITHHEFLPPKEWGIVGNWRIPILFKPKITKRVTSHHSNHVSGMNLPNPMFLSIQTCVMRPQVDCDIKYIDFGQLAIGKRAMKRVLITNYSDEYLELQSNPINAVGPFFVMNAIRGIPPGEYSNLVIECLPRRPGLTVEILELFSLRGGHQVRITLKTQGVEPIVELTGLMPPLDTTWSPLGGILDFGNVVAGDIITSKFTICNKSAFPVDAVITRTSCEGIAPTKKLSFMEKSVIGLPIFIIKPEKVRIDPNENTDIEVMFRPDRGRNKPFREDLNVFVGQTDGVIKVCLCGRAFSRQMYVLPTDPLDEQFSKVLPLTINNNTITNNNNNNTLMLTNNVENSNHNNTITTTTTTTSNNIENNNNNHKNYIDSALIIEDIYVTHLNSNIRKSQQLVRDELLIGMRPFPSITLEYPDLYANDATKYTEVDKTPKDSKVKIIYRQLIRKLTIGCIKVLDNRLKSTTNGTFDIILSQKAKDSGLFSINTEKGTIAPGSDFIVDIACTLPIPKGIGGLKVGSWQSYAADVILRGGWIMDNDSDDLKVPIILKAFVRL